MATSPLACLIKQLHSLEDNMTATMKRLGLAAAATAVAVSLAGGAYAAGQDNSGQGPAAGRPGRFGGPGRGMGPGGPGGMRQLMMLRRLDLTDAQKEQVKGIVGSHKEEAKTIGDRARTAHRALEAAITSETFDEATVRTRAADVATVNADAAVAQARGFSEIYQILTTEQQTRLKEIQAKVQERMANGPARKGPGPR
jgi:protein CpxP